MKFLKKYYKLIGTLITVVAFVFVIKKIVTMDVDWSMFASGKPLGIIAGCVLVQTAIIFFMSTPWVQFVRILSGKKIAMKDALPVYTKCNLMKYVPGNVFQYVGRNQLAADLHISHVDVACATVLEILCSLVAPLVWILLLMGKDMVGLIRTYEKNFLLVLGIGVAVLVLAFFLLRWKFREPLRRYFEKYRKLLNRKILLRVVGVFLLYVLQYLFSATMYAVPAFLMFDVPRAQMGLFLGTYLFSWVIGFITPGAPGGIGVREAVMVLTCSTFLDTNTIMLYAVTMRIISTFGDVLALVPQTVGGSAPYIVAVLVVHPADIAAAIEPGFRGGAAPDVSCAHILLGFLVDGGKFAVGQGFCRNLIINTRCAGAVRTTGRQSAVE